MFIPKEVILKPHLLTFMVVIRFLIWCFSLVFLCLVVFGFDLCVLVVCMWGFGMFCIFLFFVVVVLAHVLTSMLHHPKVQPWPSPGILPGRNLAARSVSTHVM